MLCRSRANNSDRATRLGFPKLRGERHGATPATGTAHREQNFLLLLLVEIGAIDELPRLLLEQRMERQAAIRNLILRSGRCSGLGMALLYRPAGATAAMVLAVWH